LTAGTGRCGKATGAADSPEQTSAAKSHTTAEERILTPFHPFG